MRETGGIISLIVRQECYSLVSDSLTHPGIVVAALQRLSDGDRKRGVVGVVHHVVVPVPGPRSQVVVVGILEVCVIPEGRQGKG